MSRTLFWYIFKDLVRIFLLTSAALAGIMSFGGLLRPLTDQGLDPGQSGRMLVYLMPAMLTYSLPIAAVFAAAFVYGRLSADNEVTACRAAGISHLWLATPAMVLGLLLSLATLLCLCFIVPVYWLKVERVLYSKVGLMVAREIQNTHQLRVESWNVFAQDAWVQPPEEGGARSGQQVVVLKGPMIAQYQKDAPDGIPQPREFWMARRATAYIRQNRRTDQVRVELVITNGTRFPADVMAGGGVQGDVESTQLGPIEVNSLVRENTKFMNIRQLQDLYENPRKSKKVAKELADLVARQQRDQFLGRLASKLQNGASVVLQSDQEPGRRYVLSAVGGEVQTGDGELVLRARQGQLLQLSHRSSDGESLVNTAAVVVLEAQADTEGGRMILTLTPDQSLPRRLVVQMPEEVRQLQNRDMDYYLQSGGAQAARLYKERQRLLGAIQSERHGRASFAVSCLILVLVGCALGMMFKSGNFLTAFGISMIPAMIAIVFIMMGQQASQDTTASDALRTGLMLIWSGNALVLILAGALVWRMQRQ